MIYAGEAALLIGYDTPRVRADDADDELKFIYRGTCKLLSSKCRSRD